jgi:glucuronate isomerase
MSFIHDDFLLQTPQARRLYHDFAASEPILDYHNHLPPADIARDRQFANLFEIWLEGDHYKWRAMRANGVAERFCTGDADPYEKFLAFARTVPHTLRNPLHHWTHLELKRHFGIDTLLDEKTAPAVWEQANALLAQPEMSARGILNKFQVRALCTTDDPADDLVHHRAIAESGCETRVFPTFRPDKAMAVHDPMLFNPWVDRLAAQCGRDIGSFTALKDALRARHDDFHAIGGRLSDHGLDHCPTLFATDAEAAAIFDRARAGQAASASEREAVVGNLMLLFGELDAEKGWTKQLHLGALRNNNARLHRTIGADIGCDSIGDFSQARGLSAYLGRLDERNALPKMVLYNNNPNDNYIFATMAGNFQDGVLAGKIQFGSGWWFLDQKEGMEWQINALSNCGLLSRFIGMLTDSRSFMSFPRHEYFRRTLCNLIGQDAADGLLPDDEALLGNLVSRICFANARDFLGFGG